MWLHRLPVAVPPAHGETLASYLARLASLHGLSLHELCAPISTPQPGTTKRSIIPDRLATITGRPLSHLAHALPELRDPPPDWAALRHEAQPGCPCCDARHLGGPVTRLLPHHRYVCTRHRYWIGPPDAGQSATPLPVGYDNIVAAQGAHLRLLHRHGSIAVFDAVLTGFLICTHHLRPHSEDSTPTERRWSRRAEALIPQGTEHATFSASRLFAVTYPEAVHLAAVIASPSWRHLASGAPRQQWRLATELAQRLGYPDYQPPQDGDAITRWVRSDPPHPPSQPGRTLPETRAYLAIRAPKDSQQTQARHRRSAYWFGQNRRAGNLLLGHRHLRPVLIRDWSPRPDGVAASISATQAALLKELGLTVAEVLDQPEPELAETHP